MSRFFNKSRKITKLSFISDKSSWYDKLFQNLKPFKLSLQKKKKNTQLSMEDNENDSQTSIKVRPKLKKPNMYKVLMHNDDYTLMEFVIEILISVFSKTSEEAHQIMMKVHTQGMAICGVYTFEVAESKVSKVLQLAKANGHPLKCTFEPIEGDEET